ncbi:hypothetical protein ACFVQB_10220 [Paenibacillus sp. NPDC057886]|uniref:hypothetical protein n=1 Tax=Paenibacillus sp. NPDC057886 TaxID=3346270 RepID=UPI0036B89278
MECSHCFREIRKDFTVCPYCTQPIRQMNLGSSIDGGKDNINIGFGINSRQEIHIENHNYPKEDKLIVEYSDRIDKRVPGGVNSFKRKFDIAGVISIISAVITIADFLFMKSDLYSVLLVITCCTSLYALNSLSKHKELQKNSVVYRENHVILFEKDGEVYKVKTYGICPVCQGRVYIYNDDRFKRKLGKCVNNNDHLYTYDHTNDLGVPYVYVDLIHSK